MENILYEQIIDFWSCKSRSEQLDYFNNNFAIVFKLFDSEPFALLGQALFDFASNKDNKLVGCNLEKAYALAKNDDELFFALSLQRFYQSIEEDNEADTWQKTVDKLAGDKEEATDHIDHNLRNYIESSKTMMYHYINNHIRKAAPLNNIFTVLKGWSSTTPLINSGIFENDCNGGGFYLRYNNYGIVIDPGCNFINNMHKNKIDILDIDYVIITHNHFDHISDAKGLQTLSYEYNRIFKYTKNELKDKSGNLREHNIRWIVDKESSESLDKDFDKKYVQVIPKSKMLKQRLTTLDIDEPIDGLTFRYFKTEHTSSSFGFVLSFEFESTRTELLGYTSDTMYYGDLVKHFSSCKYVIANISELSSEDLNGKISRTDTNHLKLQGCINIAKLCRPNHLIISEFWGGKDDIRLLIVKKIKREAFIEPNREHQDMQSIVNVWPADIGFSIDLQNEKARCTNCGHFVSLKDIISVQTDGAYSNLSYICRYCRHD